MNLPMYKIDIQKLLADMPDASWFTHAQIFDDLLCVANKSTASFILKTSEGLIVIDAIYPKEEMFKAIVSAIEDIGWTALAAKPISVKSTTIFGRKIHFSRTGRIHGRISTSTTISMMVM